MRVWFICGGAQDSQWTLTQKPSELRPKQGLHTAAICLLDICCRYEYNQVYCNSEKNWMGKKGIVFEQFSKKKLQKLNSYWKTQNVYSVVSDGLIPAGECTRSLLTLDADSCFRDLQIASPDNHPLRERSNNDLPHHSTILKRINFKRATLQTQKAPVSFDAIVKEAGVYVPSHLNSTSPSESQTEMCKKQSGNMNSAAAAMGSSDPSSNQGLP